MEKFIGTEWVDYSFSKTLTGFTKKNLQKFWDIGTD
jgi:hypothetical protein